MLIVEEKPEVYCIACKKVVQRTEDHQILKTGHHYVDDVHYRVCLCKEKACN